jgi:hypothetical protein
MEFVSADRSRDAEFLSGLQNYNQQVFANNKDIAAQIDDSKDQLDKDISNAEEVADLSNIKTSGALAGIGVGAVERVDRGVKEFGKYKEKAEAAKDAAEQLARRGGGVEVPVSAAEELAGPGGRFTGITNLLGDPRAERIAQQSFEEEQRGIQQVYRSGARPVSPTRTRPQAFTEQEQREFRSAVEERGAAREAAAAGEGAAEEGAERAAVKAGAEGAELTAGKVLGKLAGGVARGAGIAGAVVSAGSALEGLREGKKFKLSEQGAEIGGALLDILGTGAEFIPGGQLIGVGLQLAGTTLSGIGAAEEALDIEPQKAQAEQEAKDIQAKTQQDLEAQRQKALTGITAAAQGGSAVARQVQ